MFSSAIFIFKENKRNKFTLGHQSDERIEENFTNVIDTKTKEDIFASNNHRVAWMNFYWNGFIE